MSISLAYKKGDMLENPAKGTILVHSCNTRGVWGAGIARQFRDKFPKAYALYENACRQPYPVLGKGFVFRDTSSPHGSFLIGCLMASGGYGTQKDSAESIVANTKTAIQDMVTRYGEKEVAIHSPKINAGIFGVPWELTEKAIMEACNELAQLGYHVHWTVWVL